MRTIRLLLLAFLSLALLGAAPPSFTPYLVKDINPYPSPDSSNPSSFATLGRLTLFQVSGSLSAGVDREGLWRSDGTAAGTKRLTPQDEYRVGEIVKAGPRLFFAGWDAATGTELWAMHE
jgi:hypothetical protein